MLLKSSEHPPALQRLHQRFDAQRWEERILASAPAWGKQVLVEVENDLQGDLNGVGQLGYVLAYPAHDGGPVPFVGLERVLLGEGQAEGSLVLRHQGVFSKTHGIRGSLTLEPQLGTGPWAGRHGQGEIHAAPGDHGGHYTLHLAPQP